LQDGGVIFPLIGNMGYNVFVVVRILKVVGKLAVHHAARDEPALVQVSQRFVFAEILVELTNSKRAAALWSLQDWRRRV
jgi:hypothetical protein